MAGRWISRGPDGTRVCLAYVSWAQRNGFDAAQYVPVTMLIVAGTFALAATPTFLWLKERAVSVPRSLGEHSLTIGFQRLRHTLADSARFRDLFRFLMALTVYYCGINTVVVLAAVYAQEVMGFRTMTRSCWSCGQRDSGAGRVPFWAVQDRLGSLPTLAITLLIWIGASSLAFWTESRAGFWFVANLVGIALGSSQASGRALVGQFAPQAAPPSFLAVGTGGQARSDRWGR